MHRATMALLSVVLVLAACGGADAGTGVASLSEEASTTVTGPAGDAAGDPDETEAALLAWAACMRAEGVDIEDPTVDADGNVQLLPFGGAGSDSRQDLESIQPAFEACEGHLEGLSLGFERQDMTGFQDTLVEFASCMRDNGVDMPDPDFSDFSPPDTDGGTPGPGGGPFGDLDLEDPAIEAAMETCGDILGGFGPGGGFPGGGDG